MAYTTHNLGVAKDWVNARHDEAQSHNGNFSHTGEKLWSYNTPIGNHVQAPGGRVTLLTTESYSVTTEGKHKGAARSALRQAGEQPFYVPFLILDGATTGRSTANTIARRNNASAEEQHQGNLDDYATRIAAEQARLDRARVYKSTDTLERLTAERDRYKRVFGL